MQDELMLAFENTNFKTPFNWHAGFAVLFILRTAQQSFQLTQVVTILPLVTFGFHAIALSAGPPYAWHPTISWCRLENECWFQRQRSRTQAGLRRPFLWEHALLQRWTGLICPAAPVWVGQRYLPGFDRHIPCLHHTDYASAFGARFCVD